MLRSVSIPLADLRPYKKLRTIRYLGNKRRIDDFIRQTVINHLPEGSTILDLFSGSTAVGLALQDKYAVHSNDIQQYSEVIAQALLCRGENFIDYEDLISTIQPFYERNHKALSSLFDQWLEQEDEFLIKIDRRRFSSYEALCNSFPYYSNPNGVADTKLSSIISSEVALRKSDPSLFPFLLFSGYFALGYFSLRQCLEIDSLRYAIESTQLGIRKVMSLCALIYAIDECVTSTGHFAQFRHSNSPESFASIAEQRKKSVLELFRKSIEELFSEPMHSKFENKVSCEDYTSLLRRLDRNRSDAPALIYADPPYTADHYSRYYHVLETLCLYDYPNSVNRGRYREDRTNSGFSLRSKVKDEFRSLVDLSATLGSDLLISYTNDGMVPTSFISQKCRERYTQVEVNWKEKNHSNQGRPSGACTSRKPLRREYLIYCREPRNHG